MGLPKSRLLPLIAGGVVLVALIIGGSIWWIGKQKYETTDNAFVQADTVQVSPQVAGYVAEVLVTDNQRVEPGQVLVKLDASTFEAKLAQAQANLQGLGAAIRSVEDKANLQRAMVAQKAAAVASAQAEAQVAAADLQRYSTLSSQGWVSPQRQQSAKAGADQAAAAVAQARAGLRAEQVATQAVGAEHDQTAANAAAAQAAVQQARIDLDHTVIRAPSSGVVGARSVRTGQLVQPGTVLMAIVPLGRTYVVANFKETQVARLRVGQSVAIHADAFGKAQIKGRVESFAPATGAQFALIPVENAVGNFTKITQRVPVRIAVDSDQPLSGALRPGLSVNVKVDVSQNTGPAFAESGQGPQVAQAGEAR